MRYAGGGMNMRNYRDKHFNKVGSPSNLSTKTSKQWKQEDIIYSSVSDAVRDSEANLYRIHSK